MTETVTLKLTIDQYEALVWACGFAAAMATNKHQRARAEFLYEIEDQLQDGYNLFGDVK